MLNRDILRHLKSYMEMSQIEAGVLLHSKGFELLEDEIVEAAYSLHQINIVLNRIGLEPANDLLSIQDIAIINRIIEDVRSQLSQEYAITKVSEMFSPTRIEDAMAIAILIRRFQMLGILDSKIKSVVDLGSGDGRAMIPFWLMNFDVSMIEFDELLAHTSAVIFQKLSHQFPNQSTYLIRNDKFEVSPLENKPKTRDIISSADIMYCYPFVGEVSDRLRLFGEHAKTGAILIFCQIPIVFGEYEWIVDGSHREMMDKYGIEKVDLGIRYPAIHGLAPEDGNFPATYKFEWAMYQKK